jgi:hypothetical protein
MTENLNRRVINFNIHSFLEKLFLVFSQVKLNYEYMMFELQYYKAYST